MTLRLKSEACEFCPYRRDAPSGLWSADEYAKLREYDNDTYEQPLAWFGCHSQPNFACYGWVIVHENRGRDRELLGLRFMGFDDDRPAPDPEHFFSSGNEAADHGMRRIKRPPPEARAAMARLYALHRRLREEYDAELKAKRKRKRKPKTERGSQ